MAASSEDSGKRTRRRKPFVSQVILVCSECDLPAYVGDERCACLGEQFGTEGRVFPDLMIRHGAVRLRRGKATIVYA